MSRASVVSRIAHEECERAPSILPEGQGWWEHLSEDFPKSAEPFDLELRDRLQVGASAASDVVLRTLGATLVGTLAAPLGYRRQRMREAMADRDFYGPMAESGDATRFFKPPPKEVWVR